MAATNKFPIEETILAVLMLLAAGITMVMYRNKQKEKKRIIDAIRSRINGNAGIESSNDLASKLVSVPIDTSFNQEKGFEKLESYQKWYHQDNEGLITYLSSLNISQIKALDAGVKAKTGNNLEQWLKDELTGLTSRCVLTWGIAGCKDYDKIMSILKNK